ncbi:MAG TPA: glycosyltransferase [Chthoniobacterales bacterium]|jgi:spore maturation protein CgeB|nr:glycosyltransferase [Chthoniobacterales bacterium]
MRIFCAIRHSNDPSFYYGGLWSGNFYPALRQLGHEIIESKVDLLPTSRFMHIPSKFTDQELAVRAEITQRIIDEVRAAHEQEPIDLFLSYFYNSHFDSAGFEELRVLAIPSVNFYCNSIYQFENVAGIAAKADYSWHPEKDARELYLRVGAHPVWVQMGADSNVYRPLPDVPREASACFVGQRYADRDRWLAALDRAKVPFDIYGSGWNDASVIGDAEVARRDAFYLGREHYRPGSFASYAHVVRENVARNGQIGGLLRTAKQWNYRRETRRLAPYVFAHAKGRAESVAATLAAYDVCLNLSNVWSDGRPGSKLIPHVRLRDFEAPMCRSCYLTGHTAEIAEFYEIGKEIDAYRSQDELVEKTRFYLAHPDAAEELREAGYRRAVRDHTWKHRFKELFRKIGLS